MQTASEHSQDTVANGAALAQKSRLQCQEQTGDSTAVTPGSGWHPGAWRNCRLSQPIDYPDDVALQSVLAAIKTLPPLVTSWEVDTLRGHLAEAAVGRRFLLQGGDCAEAFRECRPAIIRNRLKVLLQMSLVLVYGMRVPVVRVGRFAGQYAKPRSAATEMRNGVTLPSYRGDNVNGPEFTPEARIPDPERLRRAYECSAMMLNYARALSDGGFADLHNLAYWNLDFANHSPLYREYQDMVDFVRDALKFADAVAGVPLRGLSRVDFYTSHEVLHLVYEEALTHHVREGYYNLSTHFPWVGMRTAHVDGAHVEYVRGLQNPIAVKIGPDTQPSELLSLIKWLDPDDQPGRLTLITRFGADRIEQRLPGLVDVAKRAGRTVLWVCDPMHGNTERADTGHKTRRYENILGELELAFDVHAKHGTVLGGVHFELTGENVTECVGGSSGVREMDLKRAYHSRVDPRLNAEQSLEMALSIVRKYRRL